MEVDGKAFGVLSLLEVRNTGEIARAGLSMLARQSGSPR